MKICTPVRALAMTVALAAGVTLAGCSAPEAGGSSSSDGGDQTLHLALQRSTGVAYLFITHDLSVVRHISHRVAVMYRGEIVETGSTADVTNNPQEEYTRSLLLAAPTADPDRQRDRRLARRRLRESIR